MAGLEDVIVMPSPSSMGCLVYYKPLAVHGQLHLHGMPTHLSRVVASSLPLIFGSRYLLLSGVYEGFEPWEVVFNLLHRLRPFSSLVQLLWDWYALLHEGLKDTYVLQHIALVEVEEKSCERRGYVQPIIHEKHEEPVLKR